MNKIIVYIYIGLLCAGISFGLSSCDNNSTTPPPPNPYDLIDYSQNEDNTPAPDSNSIVGIHTYILAQSCAVPSCHDGSFEPDFRTVQSTYSTLVLHPVVKNTPTFDFDYRVIPYDVENSWFYERTVTDDSILGRMPLYSPPLAEGALANIRNWINAGAPDMFGNIGFLPNTHPKFQGLAAFLDYGGFWIRVDTFRNSEVTPFGVQPNRDVEIWFGLEDDSTAIGDLDVQVKISPDIDDFSGVTAEPASFSAVPRIVEDYDAPGVSREFHWRIVINTGNYPTNVPVFMRLYIQDGSHLDTYEYPANQNPLEQKAYMAFFII